MPTNDPHIDTPSPESEPDDATTLASVVDVLRSVYESQLPAEFQVLDADTANRLVRLIVEARGYRERVKTWAEIERQRAETEERQLQDRYFAQLANWCRGELHALGFRRRSLSLPAGQLGFRYRAARLAIENALDLVEWCRRSLPEAIRVQVKATGTNGLLLESWAHSHPKVAECETTISKELIDEHFRQTGEIPTGCSLVSRIEDFYVRCNQ